MQGNFLTSCKPVSFSRRTLHHGVSKYIFECISWIIKYLVLKEIFKNFYYENVNWNELAKGSVLHNRKFLDEVNDQH